MNASWESEHDLKLAYYASTCDFKTSRICQGPLIIVLLYKDDLRKENKRKVTWILQVLPSLSEDLALKTGKANKNRKRPSATCR